VLVLGTLINLITGQTIFILAKSGGFLHLLLGSFGNAILSFVFSSVFPLFVPHLPYFSFVGSNEKYFLLTV